MSRRTPPAHAPGGDRPRSTARRDAVVAVAVVVGAGAVLAFDVAADSGPPEIRPAAATGITPAARTITGVQPAAAAGATDDPSALVAARTDAATAAQEQLAARREAARVAEERAAAARAAERAAQRAAAWERLADCESGRWSRDRTPIPGTARWDYGLDASEDGFFQGGLQFHPATWDQFRDRDMPEHAGNATRTQQIAVAERVLDAQGWGAWPVCSRKLGYR